MVKRDLWGVHVRGMLGCGNHRRVERRGMSSARFDIPESKKVVVVVAAQRRPAYCVRIVRWM